MTRARRWYPTVILVVVVAVFGLPRLLGHGINVSDWITFAIYVGAACFFVAPAARAERRAKTERARALNEWHKQRRARLRADATGPPPK